MIPGACYFDLDGTLTDSKPGITRSIQFALEKMGRPVPAADELEWCIGPPLLENFTKLVGAADASRAVKLYRERYGELGLFECLVYPGVVNVLQGLQSQGVRLFVASSKPTFYVTQILERFELADYFESVHGSELDGTRTDKRELLRYVLEQTGERAEEGVMIGDRSHDATGALANQIDFVAALYGYGTHEEFAEVGATRFVSEPIELLEILLPSD